MGIKPRKRSTHRKDKLMAKIKPKNKNSISVITSKANDIPIKSQNIVSNKPEKVLIANQINTSSTISSSPIFTQSIPSTSSTTPIIIGAPAMQTNNPTLGQMFLLIDSKSSATPSTTTTAIIPKLIPATVANKPKLTEPIVSLPTLQPFRFPTTYPSLTTITTSALTPKTSNTTCTTTRITESPPTPIYKAVMHSNDELKLTLNRTSPRNLSSLKTARKSTNYPLKTTA